MKVKVKDNAAGIYGKSCKLQQIPNREYMDALSRVQGKMLEASTHYLFKNSVNAYYSDDKGIRVCLHLPNEYIEFVEDDARIGKYKCRYCGNIGTKSKQEQPVCPVCEQDLYIESLESRKRI